MSKSEEFEKWLSGLKAGDEVLFIEPGSWNGSGKTIRKVERTTKTQILISGTNERIRRSTGRGPRGGDQWARPGEIRPITQEDRDDIERRKNNRLIDTKINGATNDQIRRIAKILMEPKE